MSNCNHCGSSSATVVYTTESGSVRRCTNCGLEYRRFTCTPRNVYMQPNKLSARVHANRQEETLEYLRGRGVFPASAALEIGSGAGVFARMLAKNVAMVTCIEPSHPMVKELRETTDAEINHGDVSLVAQWQEKFDLVVALGVHYLFRDHAKALADIAESLKPGGYFYLESNVFQDTIGFVGERFKTRNELYAHNPMVAYWFTPELLTQQLKRHFTIEGQRENEYGGSLVRGFFCQKAIV